MRPNKGVPRARGRRGIVAFSSLVAVSALLVFVLACGGSSASGGGDSGGGSGDGAGTLTVSPGQAKPGQVLTVRGSKLPKGTADPVVRASLVAETPSGEISLHDSINVFNQTFSQTAFVPDDLAPGEYTITLKFKGEHAGKQVSAKLTVIP
jgi:hypothetical protein